jgi:hypothetical protein
VVGIIAGMNNVRFKVDTANVTTPQAVAINISNNRIGNHSLTLTVTPPNTPLALGVRVTVNLSAGAPAEGATRMLASNNPSGVNVQRTIRSNFSGQTSAFTDVFATTVAAPTQVTITATYGSSSQSAIE